MKEKIFIHSSAIVDEGAKIGNNCKIWHWVHISSGAILGSNSSIGQNVYISGGAKVGSNVKIQNNVSIYDKVTLEDYVFCGPSVVFTNVINPRACVNRKSEYKATYVEEGATIGANSTIICGIKIGKYSFIGAGSVVTKDVKPFSLVVGNPAKHVGWMSVYGEKINLPVNGNNTWESKIYKDKYELKGEYVHLI